MGYTWQRWLADEFRAAGLTVIEVEGWEDRGRPASTGSFDPRGPVTNHHTGVTSSPDRPGPTLGTLVQGRSDLPGPLCQWSVRHDGVVVVIAAGRANHAGKVGKSGVPGMPLGADGNALALGDEVDTNGTQALPAAQRHAIAVTNAVALEHYDRGPEYAHRHQDISSTGKWDLGSLTTTEVRGDAATATTQEDYMATDAAENKLDRIIDMVTESNKRDAVNDKAERERDKADRERLARLAGQNAHLGALIRKVAAEPDAWKRQALAASAGADE